MTSIIAARIFIVLTAAVVLFQSALAAGMPWGEFAWGGAYPGTLPANMRLASGVSVLISLLMAMVVSVRAGLAMPGWHAMSRKLVWAVVAYCAVGVVANAITPSLWERAIWLPVITLCFACSLVVARGR